MILKHFEKAKTVDSVFQPGICIFALNQLGKIGNFFMLGEIIYMLLTAGGKLCAARGFLVNLIVILSFINHLPI